MHATTLQQASATGIAAMQATFAAQRRAFAHAMAPTLAQRLDRLARLLAMTDQIAPQLAQAISADFGHRPAQVTQLADVMAVRSAVGHVQRHLRRWMRPRRIPTPLAYLPGRSHVQPQPLGVVGVVSPWNYPYQLAMVPALAALAAGNRVMVKPSEMTPRFSQLLQRAVSDFFAPDEMAVVIGEQAGEQAGDQAGGSAGGQWGDRANDVDLARAFVALPFDHLLFTGSTAVGRAVALAAAANLTPTTLELGGKSPAILNADCDLAQAVPRLMAAKLLNTGQTCIAPDYLLVHDSLLNGNLGRLLDALRAATLRLYPGIADNPDYASIAAPRHLARLQALLDDAQAQGARVLPLHTETATVNGKLPPFAVLGATNSMRVMQEEIFGPLLPVLPYSDLGDAIAYVNAHDRPLALYWFGRRQSDLQTVLTQTVSGGVTVNDCLWHVAQPTLPFGGVGASGHGRYHGEYGFRTFSHDKPVFTQSRWAGTGLMAPPYGRTFDWLARCLRRIG